MEQQGKKFALTSFFAVPVDLGAGRFCFSDINLEINLRGTTLNLRPIPSHRLYNVTYKAF